MDGKASAIARIAPARWYLRLHRALMPDYNCKAAAYWWTMALLGATALAVSAADVLQLPRTDLLQVLLGVAIATGVGLFPVRIPGSKNSFAAGEVYIFLLLAMYGPAAATLAAGAEAALGAYRSSKRWTSRLCSPAMAAVAMAGCGTLYAWTAAIARDAGLLSPGLFVVLLMTLGAVYSFVNSVAVSTIFKLKRDEPLALLHWVRDWGWIGLTYVATAALAALLFLCFEQFGVSVFFISVPMLAMFLATLHHYFARQELAEQERAARVAAAEQHVRELEQSEKRFQSAFTFASIGMALVAMEGRVLQANRALGALLGRDPGEIVQREFHSFLFGEDVGLLQQQLLRVKDRDVEAFTVELRCRHASGQEIWVSLHCGFFADSSSTERCLIFQVHDISARRRAEGRLQHVAYHDSLTGLANRSRFNECLLQALENHRTDPARHFALMYLDFDRFKLINDSLGHNAGDEFLVKVARRIQEHTRSGDVVARLGGDEFAILTQHFGATHEVVVLAERLQEVLGRPLQIAGRELSTSASIGITFSEVGYQTPDEVLRDADLAMYEAKAKGRARFALFDNTLHRQATEQLSLESELRRAIESGQLSLAFQPIYELAPRRIVAMEALIRWHHPERGPISPATFIPLAEESGLITRLSCWVVERACAQLAAWRSKYPGLSRLGVHVNVSSKDFGSDKLVSHLTTVLDRTGLCPSLVTLELTENALMERVGAAADTLMQLRNLGVGLSIDDFGTGYSSLSYLSTLPIGSLKIDRSFVRDMHASAAGAEIVRTILNLGTSLGRQVIAEGIETPRQLERLLQLGCKQGQGFLLSQPLTHAQAEQLLASEAAELLAASERADVAQEIDLLATRLGSPLVLH